MGDGITVRGVGRLSRVADVASVTVGVEATAAGAGEAQATASARAAAVIEALRAAGVRPADMTTTRIALGPMFDYSGPAPRMTGYAAAQSLRVRVRDLAGLGPVIDRAISAGATVVDEVAFGLAEPGPAVAEAREVAMADARGRAEALARAAGVALGRALSITETPVVDGPRPMAKAALEMAAASDTPVASGAHEVVVEVEVRFAILG